MIKGEYPMTEPRITQLARILVDYSTGVRAGDKVYILTGTAAHDLVCELYRIVLDRGGYPQVLLEFDGQEEIFYAHAGPEQIDTLPSFYKTTFEESDVLIKIRAQTNTRALSNVPPERVARRQKALAPLLHAQIHRGAERKLRWMSTLFPTQAYAMEADMGLAEFEDFVYRACYADEGTPDPIAQWEKVKVEQERIINQLEGHEWVELRGPNVDLKLSIAGRIIKNASGENNMPDGEIYTGPVENSASGWVRFTYPAVSQSRVVEGVELRFEEGKVVSASAQKNEAFLLQMLDTDPGARYLGEFAIGTNYQIDRAIKNILFDEKIGGSFHLAVGSSYPDTGGVNKSAIHWDMICDLKQDSEILVDGELVYRDGRFVS